MLNQSVLVGRLTSDLEVRETEKGKHISTITLAVPRSYKNENGEYDTDFIDIVLWNSVAENTADLNVLAVLLQDEADTVRSAAFTNANITEQDCKNGLFHDGKTS